MSKRILVAGGAGFIGSHLCQKLLNEGHEVVCLDNMVSGQVENIQHLMESPSFTFIYGDVNELPDVGAPEEIYNLACPASPSDYQAITVETVKTNVMGSINLLELAVTNKAKILQASTSEIYGNPLEHPQKESYWGSVNPVGTRSCYDEGKRCAETLFSEYHRKFGLEIKIARIFNTYGPNMRMNDGRVVSNFVVQALSHAELTVNGEGLHSRSFCYVEDIVDGLVKLMGTGPEITGPINIGNPQEITIRELALKVVSLSNSMSQITFQKVPLDDPERTCPDITMAKEILDWKPHTDLETGLNKTIDYFRSLV